MMNHILGWILIIGSVVILAVAVYFWSRVSQQSSWSEGRARIIQSSVSYDWELYRSDIQYEYTVGGNTRIGEKVRSGMLQYNWRGPAARTCAKYPVGSEHPVFFDEGDPTDAVLETGGDAGFVPLALVVGGVFLLVGLGFLVGK
jgi:hypothetical protein